jgi:hypothetical protein
VDLEMEFSPRGQKSPVATTPARLSPVLVNPFLEAPTANMEIESPSVRSSASILPPPVAPLIPLQTSTDVLKTPPTEKPKASILTSPVGRKMLTASMPLVSMSPFSPRKEVEKPSRVIPLEPKVEGDCFEKLM